MRTAVVPVPSHTVTLSDAKSSVKGIKGYAEGGAHYEDGTPFSQKNSAASRCIPLHPIRKISYIRLLSRKVKLSCSFSMRKITENILMKVMKKSAKRIASKP